MTPTYDVFVSYTKRRNVAAARILADSLVAAGYSVWFDEKILNRKESWIREAPEYLLSLLKAAVQDSQCVVAFSLVEEALLPADYDRELAARAHQIAKNEHGLWVAWSWQAFELQHANQALILETSADSQPDVVMAKLREMGVRPSVRIGEARVGLAVLMFRALSNWLNRERRLAALFATLPRTNSAQERDETFLDDRVFHAISRLRNLYERGSPLVVIGARGSGRTTFVDQLAHQLRQHFAMAMLRVTLPAKEDIEHWTDMVLRTDESTIIVFDDLVDQLQQYSPADPRVLWKCINEISRVRESVWVLSPEQAHISNFPYSNRNALERRLFLSSAHSVEQFDHRATLLEMEIDGLIRWHWRRYEESGQIKFETEKWSAHLLASRLKIYPIYSNLSPVDYRTLEGLQLSEPTKSLAVLRKVIEMAKPSAPGQPLRVTDDAFDEVLSTITGIHRRDSANDENEFVSSVLEGFSTTDIALAEVLKLIHVSAFGLMRTRRGPLSELCIQDGDKRRRLATRLAEELLGSRDAVIYLNYEAISDQIVDGTLPYTDTFRWMLRAVRRFPWWIIVFESLDKATDLDRRGVQKLVIEGEIAFQEFQASFDRCVLLFDSFDVFGDRPPYGSIVLDL